MIQKYPLIKNRSTKKQHLAVYEKSIKAKTNSILVSLWNKQHKHKQLPYPKPKENGSFELTHNPKNYHVLSSTDSQFNHSSKTERTPWAPQLRQRDPSFSRRKSTHFKQSRGGPCSQCKSATRHLIPRCRVHRTSNLHCAAMRSVKDVLFSRFGRKSIFGGGAVFGSTLERLRTRKLWNLHWREKDLFSWFTNSGNGLEGMPGHGKHLDCTELFYTICTQ